MISSESLKITKTSFSDPGEFVAEEIVPIGEESAEGIKSPAPAVRK